MKQPGSAKGGKSVEITTHSDERRMFIDVQHGTAHLRNGRLEDEDGNPVKLDRPMYVNLPPAPSATDSIWQAVWRCLCEAW